VKINKNKTYCAKSIELSRIQFALICVQDKLEVSFASKNSTPKLRISFKNWHKSKLGTNPFCIEFGAKDLRGSISSDLSIRAGRGFLSKDPPGADFLTKGSNLERILQRQNPLQPDPFRSVNLDNAR